MSNSKIVPLAQTIFSIYRAQLREVRKLPHLYLQKFYQLKFRDDARTLLAPSGVSLAPQRLKRATRAVRLLRRANVGDAKAFDRILALAFGRNGKLKHELLEPLLEDPGVPKPEPIIKALPNSVPPTYPKALIALLTHPHSMTTRPLRKDAWTPAAILPARADPKSEEAHLYGPLSRRRIYNKLWRFYRTETDKVLPPIELSIVHQEGQGGPDVAGRMPFQRLGLVKEIEDLVGTAGDPPLTRKERKAVKEEPQRGSGHPSRWVRRRYRSLLSKLPILEYSQRPGKSEGSYSVRVSNKALKSRKATDEMVREIDDVNFAWLELGTTTASSTRGNDNPHGI